MKEKRSLTTHNSSLVFVHRVYIGIIWITLILFCCVFHRYSLWMAINSMYLSSISLSLYTRRQWFCFFFLFSFLFFTFQYWLRYLKCAACMNENLILTCVAFDSFQNTSKLFVCKHFQTINFCFAIIQYSFVCLKQEYDFLLGLQDSGWSHTSIQFTIPQRKMEHIIQNMRAQRKLSGNQIKIYEHH